MNTIAERIKAAASYTERFPSQAQREAGNYPKGKCWIHGMEVSIENPKGSVRSGVSSDGKPWSVRLGAHYGYIRRFISDADGDQFDVFIGPHPESQIVFVIDQQNPSKRFDEHKAVFGCLSEAEAKKLYHDCYSSGWTGFRSITPMTIGQFRAWLIHGDTGRPIANQVSKYGKDAAS